MSEFEQDPSASTGRFRAFVQQAQEEERADRSSPSRGLLIGGVVVLALVIIVILAVTL
jgi:hypothetical protein